MNYFGRTSFKIILVVCLYIIIDVDINHLDAYINLAVQNKPPKGCTIFTSCLGEKVFFCGNLDHPNPDGYIWIWPASKEGYGGILHGYYAKVNERSWIGYEGGMNVRGLAFDTNGLPDTTMNPHPEKTSSWATDNFWRRMLKKCSNVNEAIEMANDFDFGDMMDFQVHVADSSGEAVIISPGAEGELSFTRKKEGEKFLVSTNFNNANPKHRHGEYPCKRYETAVDMLKKIEREDNLSINYLRSILDAVHFEGTSYNTIYSYICDLKGSIFYLYHFHQFDEVVVFDLRKELAKGERTVKIGDLVAQKTRDRASEEYQASKRAKAKKR